MSDTDLTMTEALHDPMIRLLLRADRISLGEFARVMEKAARTKDLPLPIRNGSPSSALHARELRFASRQAAFYIRRVV